MSLCTDLKIFSGPATPQLSYGMVHNETTEGHLGWTMHEFLPKNAREQRD